MSNFAIARSYDEEENTYDGPRLLLCLRWRKGKKYELTFSEYDNEWRDYIEEPTTFIHWLYFDRRRIEEAKQAHKLKELRLTFFD